MHIYHLSHIDLDGYGCQLVLAEFFAKDSVFFYNANYGREVGARIEQIISKIKASQQKEIWIVISDLNLSLLECEELMNAVLELNLQGYKIVYELFDHHKSGQECASKYPWYFLDTKRCATKIVYEMLLERYEINEQSKAWLSPLVEMINSIDLWQEDGFGFEFGKVAMRFVAESKEFNRFMFDEQDRNFKLTLLRQSSQFLAKPKGHILFDNALLELKKKYLLGSLLQDTLDNLISHYQACLLGKMANGCAIVCKSYQGLLSFGIGNISVLANLFLKQNPHFDFFLDVSPRGNISLRANGGCDVSIIAMRYFHGGGHPNASGGKIEGFKESFVYDEIKNLIQSILKEGDDEQSH